MCDVMGVLKKEIDSVLGKRGNCLEMSLDFLSLLLGKNNVEFTNKSIFKLKNYAGLNAVNTKKEERVFKYSSIIKSSEVYLAVFFYKGKALHTGVLLEGRFILHGDKDQGFALQTSKQIMRFNVYDEIKYIKVANVKCN